MEKRMVLAIGLSLLILFGFQILGPRTEDKTPPPSPQETQVQPRYEDTDILDRERPAPYAPDKEKVYFPEQENIEIIRSGDLELKFSDVGGTLKAIVYSPREGGPEETEQLYRQEVPEKRIFATRTDLLYGLDKAQFHQEKGKGYISYTFSAEGQLEITKKYFLDIHSNAIRLEIKTRNLSGRTLPLSYRIVGPGYMEQQDGVVGRNFLEANTLLDGKVWRVRRPRGDQERKGEIAWTALKNRYFGMVLKPVEGTRQVVVKEAGENNFTTELRMEGWTLPPRVSVSQEYVFFAGPLNEQLITEVSQDMAPLVSYGFFGGVSKFLLIMLRFFHRVVGNWGVSIILLTLVINIVLFPLAVKSFVSMHQMKKIQPHIMRLKELHKDNPQKLNKETMELYKKNNVNPLGGCLPLLLQMPIFIALYQGLIRSIELKGASFLWIKDLARPDAVPLPFSLPVVGNSLNVLPLLMVAMMVIQQKITQAATAKDMTEEQRNQQRMMMMLMPIIFGFMFYSMPSGLVLYWLTNTILMTAGQKVISTRLEAR